jgi:hypothetical protein
MRRLIISSLFIVFLVGTAFLIKFAGADATEETITIVNGVDTYRVRKSEQISMPANATIGADLATIIVSATEIGNYTDYIGHLHRKFSIITSLYNNGTVDLVFPAGERYAVRSGWVHSSLWYYYEYHIDPPGGWDYWYNQGFIGGFNPTEEHWFADTVVLKPGENLTAIFPGWVEEIDVTNFRPGDKVYFVYYGWFFDDYNYNNWPWWEYTSEFSPLWPGLYEPVTASGSSQGGVGGIVIPIDKFSLLSSYTGLASTIVVATVATTIYVKRVKCRKEKQ